jgi:hypothetical protein
MSIAIRLAARRALLTALLMSGVATTASAANAYLLAGSVAAGGSRTHAISVGLYDNQVVVRGTPGRDIDCWVYDSDGDLVDEDTDPTSICLLNTPGVGTHHVEIRNLSGRRSDYALWQRQ